MFGIKTFIKKKILYPEFLFPKDDNKFPAKPVSKIRIKARLLGLLNKLEEHKKNLGLGNLLTFPTKEAINVWKTLLPYNPNNLGNWSIKEIKPSSETAKIERELIYKMIDLYHGNKDRLEGYVSSGGTEANIFSAWAGRKFLENKKIKKDNICFLKTSLTHYSIGKAADIIGVKDFVVGLNEKSWGMDVSCLEKTVKSLSKKGFRGFLLPLTIGYTLTGTVDPYKDICLRIRELKKKIKGIEFFVWLDAALNGLIEPFLNEKFHPFAFPEIQTFLTDFHKFGFVPYPAGIILYRSKLRQLIEKPIDYLEEKDNTLLGSRSGISPVSCLMTIDILGKKGFKNIILRRKALMDDFIKRNNFCFKKYLKFIVFPRSLNFAIIFSKGYNYKKFAKKYNLNFKLIKVVLRNKTKEVLISKVFFTNMIKS